MNLNNFKQNIPWLTFIFFLSSGLIKAGDSNRCEIQLKHMKNENHPYHGGDYSDIFLKTGNKYRSIFSVPKRQDEKMPCFIGIEYFNVTTRTFDAIDWVDLTSNLKSDHQLPEPSAKGKWETIYHDRPKTILAKTQSDAYILRNTSGKKYFQCTFNSYFT